MKVYDPEGFVKEVLPELVVGDNLQVLFSTYKDVHGYKDGEVATGKSGLKIIVLNGDLEYSRATNYVMHPDHNLALMASRRMDKEARCAQDAVEGCFLDAKGSLNPNSPLLVFIYVGLVAFDESVAFARKVRTDFPQAKVTVLTCDCGQTQKLETLEPLMNKEIDYAIVSERCGCRTDMKNILEAIVAKWPQK